MKKTLLSILLAGTMLSSVAVAGINPVNIDESTHSKNIYKAIKADIAEGKKSGVDSGFAWVEVNGEIYSASLQSIRNASDPAKAFADIVKDEAIVDQLKATTAKITEVKGEAFEKALDNSASAAELNIAKSRISFLEAKEALFTQYIEINATGDLTAEEIEEQLVGFTEEVKEAHGEYLALVQEYVSGVYATAVQAGKDSRNAEVAGLKSNISGLESDIVAANGVIDGLNADLVVANTAIDGLNADLTAEKAKVASLEADLVAEQVKYNNLYDNATSYIDGLEDQLATANGTIADRDATIVDLNAELATANSNIATLTDQLATANSTIAGLEVNIATLDDTIEGLEESIALKDSEIVSLNITLNNANADLAATAASLVIANNTIDSLNADLVDAADTLKATQDQAVIDIAASYTAGVNSVGFAGGSTPSTLVDDAGFTLSFHAEANNGDAIYVDTAGYYFEYNPTAATVTIVSDVDGDGVWTSHSTPQVFGVVSVSEATTAIGFVSGQAAVNQLIGERDALIVEVAELKAAAVIDTAKIAELEAEIVTKDTAITGLQADLADANSGLAAANANISSLTADLATANASVATLTADLAAANAEVVELMAEVADANTMIGTLTGELSDAQDALAAAQAEVATLTADLATANATVATLTADLATANNSIDTLTAANDTAYADGFAAGTQSVIDSEIAKVKTGVSQANGVITVTAAYLGDKIDGSASTFTLQEGINITPAVVDGVVQYTLSFDLPEYAFEGVDVANYDVDLSEVQSNADYTASNFTIDFASNTYAEITASVNQAIDAAYGQGYDDGYDAGYADGYADGFADGRATN